MFTLIISVISIALITATVIATTYYMNTVFGKETAEVDASQFIIGGEQISAAFIISAFDGSDPSVWLQNMVPEYLITIPTYKGHSLNFHNTHKNYMTATVSREVCLEINSRSSITVDAPDVTQYAYSCLLGDDDTTPLAFYKVVNTVL